MLQSYKANDGDRIDLITYNFYKSLEPLEIVIQMNSDLPEVLAAGQIVLLPPYTIKPKKEKLW